MVVRCRLCGRKLTTPKSIKCGYGPVCWEKSYARHLEEARELRVRAEEQGKRIEKIVEDVKSLRKKHPIPEVPDDDRWKDYRPEKEND